MEGCTDGVFRGKRYFLCILGKGYFCRIDDLQPLSAIHHSTNAGTIIQQATPTVFYDYMCVHVHACESTTMCIHCMTCWCKSKCGFMAVV